MRHHSRWIAVLAVGVCLFAGCPAQPKKTLVPRRKAPVAKTEDAKAPGGKTPAPARPAVAINWVEKNVQHGGATIQLGFRPASDKDKKSLTPVAEIVRGGKPVASAMVFVRLAGEGAKADEVATVYEPAAGKNGAVYVAKGLPASSKQKATFRIVLPDAAEDFTREIALP